MTGGNLGSSRYIARPALPACERCISAPKSARRMSRPNKARPGRVKRLMRQSIYQVGLVVREYDEALGFYVGTLGFTLLEDKYVPQQDKRWVVVAPPGSQGARLLLARAIGEEQASRIGNQTGGRVFLFLYTDDFWRDFHTYKAKGVVFVREPREESYGTVAVFQDI